MVVPHLKVSVVSSFGQEGTCQKVKAATLWNADRGRSVFPVTMSLQASMYSPKPYALITGRARQSDKVTAMCDVLDTCYRRSC